MFLHINRSVRRHDTGLTGQNPTYILCPQVVILLGKTIRN